MTIREVLLRVCFNFSGEHGMEYQRQFQEDFMIQAQSTIQKQTLLQQHGCGSGLVVGDHGQYEDYADDL